MSVRDVIILGCGPTFAECDYHCETWGVNGTYTFAKKLDKLFMTDGPSQVLEDVPNAHMIKRFGCPLILADRFPGITEDFEKAGVDVQTFPINELMAKFNKNVMGSQVRFYSDSIAYMIAYALLYTKTEQGPNDPMPRVVDGYGTIYLYGIDLMTSSCYLIEKGGVEFWMGVAAGMGVKVINTKGSATGKTWNGRMYGHYGDMEEERVKERLLAPWELVKAVPGPKPITEWKREGKDWIKTPYNVPK